VVVVEVDVEVLVDEDVAGLLVVVLLVVVLLVVVLLVVAAMVVVVVGTIVVIVDVVLDDVDTRLLVPAGDSAVRESELLGASHPVATRTTVMIRRVTSLVNGSATLDRDATPAVCQRAFGGPRGLSCDAVTTSRPPHPDGKVPRSQTSPRSRTRTGAITGQVELLACVS
jgi:hypothetical protein